MSIKITTNQNTVTVADADKSITIINNREPSRIEVVQPESNIIYVATPGPQGPTGASGGAADVAGLNAFSSSILTFTSSIQSAVNNLTAATSSYVLTSTTSSLIVSGALTASYYQETDPVFTAKSSSLATTGSNTFVGDQIISGNLLPAGPYVANTSSFALGSPTAAWKDLYVGNGSVYFVSGSTSASIQVNQGTMSFSGVNLDLPSGSVVLTSSLALQAVTASYVTASTIFGSNIQSRGATAGGSSGMFLGPIDANVLTFATNNTRRMTVGTSGSITIGSTNPANNDGTSLTFSHKVTNHNAKPTFTYYDILVNSSIPASQSMQTGSANYYGLATLLQAEASASIALWVGVRTGLGSFYNVPAEFRRGSHYGFQVTNLNRGVINYGLDISGMPVSTSQAIHRNLSIAVRDGAPAWISGALYIGQPGLTSFAAQQEIGPKLHILAGGLTGSQTVFLLQNSASSGATTVRDLMRVTNDNTASFRAHLLPNGTFTGTPAVTSSWDLGSPTRAWRSLYVAGQSIYFITGGEVSSSFSSSFVTETDPETGEPITSEVITEIQTIISASVSQSMKVNEQNKFTFDAPVAVVSGSISASIAVSDTGKFIIDAPVVITTGSITITSGSTTASIGFDSGGSITFGAPIIIPSGSNAVTFPYSGSAGITGSLVVTGSVDINGSITNNIFYSNFDTLISNAINYGIGYGYSGEVLSYDSGYPGFNINTSCDIGSLMYLEDGSGLTAGEWNYVEAWKAGSTHALGFFVRDPITSYRGILLEGYMVLPETSIDSPGIGLRVFFDQLDAGGNSPVSPPVTFTTVVDNIQTGTYIRSIGHLLYSYSDGANTYWILRFKPSNDWTQVI